MPGLVQQDPLILQLHAECGIREHINIRPGEKNSVFGFAEVMMDCGQVRVFPPLLCCGN